MHFAGAGDSLEFERDAGHASTPAAAIGAFIAGCKTWKHKRVNAAVAGLLPFNACVCAIVPRAIRRRSLIAAAMANHPQVVASRRSVAAHQDTVWRNVYPIRRSYRTLKSLHSPETFKVKASFQNCEEQVGCWLSPLGTHRVPWDGVCKAAASAV